MSTQCITKPERQTIINFSNSLTPLAWHLVFSGRKEICGILRPLTKVQIKNKNGTM